MSQHQYIKSKLDNNSRTESSIFFSKKIFLVSFLISTILGRFLFPFGDEPDFFVRTNEIVNSEINWWMPYNFFNDFLSRLNITPNCHIDSEAFSIWVHIDSISCTESIEQITFRLLLTFSILLPILILILINTRHSFSLIKKLNSKITSHEWNHRIKATKLALIFPSVIYYSGLLSHEQFTLALSFFIFIFWGIWWLVAIIFSIIVASDIGNSMIIVAFIAVNLTINLINKIFGIKTALITMTLLLIFAYISGYTNLNYLVDIDFLSNKALAISDSLADGFYIEKYPVILRPFITFMSGIFMTPSGIKILPLYVTYMIFNILLIIKIITRYKKSLNYKEINSYDVIFIKKSIVFLLASVTTTILFIFLFPTHTHAKYYAFMIPFIVYACISNFREKTIAILFLSSLVILFINLFLFRF